jgi:hypothetical protein
LQARLKTACELIDKQQTRKLSSADEQRISESCAAPPDGKDLRTVVDGSDDLQNALMRFLIALSEGASVDRDVVACASVLVSAALLSPSDAAFYTQKYHNIMSNGYLPGQREAGALERQDKLIDACLHQLCKHGRQKSFYSNQFHGNDASFHTTRKRRQNWWLMVNETERQQPLRIVAPCDCVVYTCGDRPTPFPEKGDVLYADDSLLWTHTSRFWSYPCWGKHWSDAAARKSPASCTRFVIHVREGSIFQCFPMEMTDHFKSEVHIAEAPLHIGALLDSIVLYAPDGINVRVTNVDNDVKHENFTSEMHCDLISAAL